MTEARELISVFHEMNNGGGHGVTSISRFTPALVGMIGASHMFNALLDELDTALSRGMIPEELRIRARNLAKTFIPQVAALNGIAELPVEKVSPDDLRGIRADSPCGRREGVKVILAALMKILNAACRIG